MQDGGLGTGLIPLENIVGQPAMARGIADFVDSVTLRRENGGTAVIRFKTYEMGRKAFQGEAGDEVGRDEEPAAHEKGEGGNFGRWPARVYTHPGRGEFMKAPPLGVDPA